MDNAVVNVVSSSFAALLMLSIAFVNVLDPMGTFVATWINPERFATEVGLAIPLLLSSLMYQKIVPSITKLLGFDRAKTTAAIAIGSLIPMGMYMMWCYAALGGGLDGTTASGARAAACTHQRLHFNGAF
jgi:tyrosine-specific transport protein